MFTIRTGDTSPPIEATLTDADGPIDLANATVRAVCRKRGATELLFDRAPTVIDEAAGIVEVEWAEDGSETSVPGFYELEFEVTRAGEVQTFPNQGPVIVRIDPDLDYGISAA